MIIDLSLPIKPSMPVWPGQPRVDIKPLQRMERDKVRVSTLSFSSHIGTHVDAPSHFLADGQTVEQLPPERLIGKARVLDLTRVKQAIEPRDLDPFSIQKCERILLKTRNSRHLTDHKFYSDFVYLSVAAAKYLIGCGIWLVGIDYLGIEQRGQAGHPVHRALLAAGIIIVEGLYLEKVSAGTYDFYCLPLKIIGCDGSPARAVLVKR